jgi:GT2 family glycosyltransferase
MSKTKKVGVGVTTFNRLDYLKGLIDSLIPCKNVIDELIVINDAGKKPEWNLPFGNWIDNEVNLGVAKTKNKALKTLLDKDCDYVFIIEDDMIVKEPTVFEQYIKACDISGIEHFNYGPGSPFNRKQTIQNFDLHNRHLLEEKSEVNPQLIVDYKTCKIALYQHTVAMFSFFTKNVLNKVGFYPEEYDRCWEHVDHTYQIIKAGYHPPFWWFADLANSHELLEEAPGAIENSSIATDKAEWMLRVNEGREIYKNKHGHYPNQPPLHTKEQVIETLKQLKNKK